MSQHRGTYFKRFEQKYFTNHKLRSSNLNIQKKNSQISEIFESPKRKYELDDPFKNSLKLEEDPMFSLIPQKFNTITTATKGKRMKNEILDTNQFLTCREKLQIKYNLNMPDSNKGQIYKNIDLKPLPFRTVYYSPRASRPSSPTRPFSPIQVYRSIERPKERLREFSPCYYRSLFQGENTIPSVVLENKLKNQRRTKQERNNQKVTNKQKQLKQDGQLSSSNDITAIDTKSSDAPKKRLQSPRSNNLRLVSQDRERVASSDKLNRLIKKYKVKTICQSPQRPKHQFNKDILKLPNNQISHQSGQQNAFTSEKGSRTLRGHSSDIIFNFKKPQLNVIKVEVSRLDLAENQKLSIDQGQETMTTNSITKKDSLRQSLLTDPFIKVSVQKRSKINTRTQQTDQIKKKFKKQDKEQKNLKPYKNIKIDISNKQQLFSNKENEHDSSFNNSSYIDNNGEVTIPTFQKYQEDRANLMSQLNKLKQDIHQKYQNQNVRK